LPGLPCYNRLQTHT
jgi:hypothetical protein